MTRRYVVKNVWCPLHRKPKLLKHCINCDHYDGHDIDLDEWVDCKHIRPRRNR